MKLVIDLKYIRFKKHKLPEAHGRRSFRDGHGHFHVCLRTVHDVLGDILWWVTAHHGD